MLCAARVACVACIPCAAPLESLAPLASLASRRSRRLRRHLHCLHLVRRAVCIAYIALAPRRLHRLRRAGSMTCAAPVASLAPCSVQCLRPTPLASPAPGCLRRMLPCDARRTPSQTKPSLDSAEVAGQGIPGRPLLILVRRRATRPQAGPGLRKEGSTNNLQVFSRPNSGRNGRDRAIRAGR